jgi:phage terminase Nu1 subunit (DNA packaging protein)
MKTYTVTIDKSGTKRWYIDDELHRENGPAIEYADGDRFWYIDGKLHREDGPAIERAGGYEAWYINGSELTQEQFNQRTAKNLTPSVKVVEIDGVKYELKKID